MHGSNSMEGNMDESMVSALRYTGKKCILVKDDVAIDLGNGLTSLKGGECSKTKDCHCEQCEARASRQNLSASGSDDDAALLAGMFTVTTPSMKSREKAKMPPKKAEWWQVTLYLLNDIIGSWLMLFSALVLGMYGWALGMVLLIVLWPVNMYIGHLLWRCRNIFPGAISIGDLVYYVTQSSWAMYIAFFFVNITILLMLSNQVATGAASLYWMTGFTTAKCSVVCFTAMCIVLYPLTQLRTLHSLSVINGLNLVAMLGFIVILIYFLVSGGVDEGAVTRVKPSMEAIRSGMGISDSISGFVVPLLGLDIMFTAYAYQLLVLEIIAEMKDPRDFPKANYWCTPFVLFVTLCCAGFRYYYQGEFSVINKTSVFRMLDSIFFSEGSSHAVLGKVAMICLTFSMLGHSLIRSVILTRSMQLLLRPKFANIRSWRSRLEWAAISLVIVILTWAFSLFIRSRTYFATITGLLALCVSMALPVILYIVCCKKMRCRKTPGKKMTTSYEWVFIVVLLISFATVMTVYALKFWYLVAKKDMRVFYNDLGNSTRAKLHDFFNCSSGFGGDII